MAEQRVVDARPAGHHTRRLHFAVVMAAALMEGGDRVGLASLMHHFQQDMPRSAPARQRQDHRPVPCVQKAPDRRTRQLDEPLDRLRPAEGLLSRDRGTAGDGRNTLRQTSLPPGGRTFDVLERGILAQEMADPVEHGQRHPVGLGIGPLRDKLQDRGRDRDLAALAIDEQAEEPSGSTLR